MRLSIAVLLGLLLVNCSEPADTAAVPDNSVPAVVETAVENAVDNVVAENDIATGDWDLGFMAAVANPYATDAAATMLARGGHAVDAAIAAHAVLGLVEPESSGLGGGGFMVLYEAESGEVRFLDGRETAPMAASIDMFMNDGEPMPYLQAWQSGRAVGVPGAVALYKLAHDRYGQLDWAEIFQPAIDLAREGFLVTEKMANYLPGIANIARLDENPGSAEYFYPNGEPLQAGDLLRNPEYAETLQAIVEQGPDAFYRGEIAEAIVASAQAEPNPGSLTMEDIAAYEAIERPAVCGPWRELTICSATPPSSGAMQIMVANLYDHLLPDNASLEQQVQAFVDAQRLAYADRDYYFGDPDRVDVPIEQLLDPAYIEYRASNPVAPDAMPEHGDPGMVLGEAAAAVFAPDSTREPAGTTHYSIIDSYGNAVSVTMTVESVFGSNRWAAGFLLNNEMTDFSRDYDPEQPEAANAVRPGARPRSSMSPSILLDADGDLYMVTGSPGGNSIPAYTAKTILATEDWGLSVQEAVDFPNIIARGQTVRVEIGREPGQALADYLNEAGYDVQESEGENSGLHVIRVHPDHLEGAADPRREGTVMTTAPL
jgi:gamma-glutamyltranspeptidase/glutathione hydrolase